MIDSQEQEDNPDDEVLFQEGYIFLNEDDSTTEYSFNDECWVETIRNSEEEIISERDLSLEEFQAILKKELSK